MEKKQEKLKINIENLSIKYNRDKNTIREYAKTYIKDLKNPTEDEYKAFMKFLEGKKRVDQKKNELNEIYSGENLGGTIKFEEKTNSLEKRLTNAINNYNFFSRMLEIDKAKLLEVKEDKEMDASTINLYNNMVATTSKAVNMWDTRLDDIENKLGYKVERKVSPFGKY